jgi:exo-1,4-beta-D-glucosaminidase
VAELNYKKTNWYSTAITNYGDLTALQKLPPVKVVSHASSKCNGSNCVTSVTVSAPESNNDVAFFVHVSIDQRTGVPVTPICWSDNDFSLWPGESMTVTAHYRSVAGGAPSVRMAGWNVASQVDALSLP